MLSLIYYQYIGDHKASVNTLKKHMSSSQMFFAHLFGTQELIEISSHCSSRNWYKVAMLLKTYIGKALVLMLSMCSHDTDHTNLINNIQLMSCCKRLYTRPAIVL